MREIKYSRLDQKGTRNINLAYARIHLAVDQRATASPYVSMLVALPNALMSAATFTTGSVRIQRGNRGGACANASHIQADHLQVERVLVFVV